MKIKVIGAGLAGSEAAWQLAQRGLEVELYEMRPVKSSPAVMAVAPSKVKSGQDSRSSRSFPSTKKQAPPSRNMLPWLRPRYSSSITVYRPPPRENRNVFLQIFMKITSQKLFPKNKKFFLTKYA